jgi:aspartate kinase
MNKRPASITGARTFVVHKFGGTSLGDAARFRAVADIVLRQDPAPVVVVSAMAGVTSRLIAGARAAAEGRDAAYREIKAALLEQHLAVIEALLPRGRERLEVAGFVEDRLHELERLYRSIAVLGEVTLRGMDAVAAFGEQLSSRILAAVLRAAGARARAVSATDLIVTDAVFGGAKPLMAPTRERLRARVAPLVAQGMIPVVTGYIAATAEGVTTTLGRGGSDYTAALVGVGLDADEVWIWSDVNGILTADPNLVPGARTLAELSYAEAADLAYFGADVLHPKTIRPVIEHGIPLRILNSFDPAHPGTRIVRAPGADRERLPAIISTAGLTMIAIGSRDDTWTLARAARALTSLSDAGVDVLMFSQSFSEHSLNLVVRERDQAHTLHVLRSVFGEGLLAAADGAEPRCSLGVKERVATISVVGVPGWNGLASPGGIVPHVFAALGKQGTRVIAVAQAATEHNVSFCIPEDQVGDTVRFLHAELGLA